MTEFEYEVERQQSGEEDILTDLAGYLAGLVGEP